MAGPRFSLVWDGLERLIDKLRRRPDRVVEAIAGALFVDLTETISAAKRITPVDEGILRASGHVQLPEIEGDFVTVIGGFGGPAGSGNVGEKTNEEDVGYAVYVHENLVARHTVGQAKFLETPWEARRKDFPRRFTRRVVRRLRSGV